MYVLFFLYNSCILQFSMSMVSYIFQQVSACGIIIVRYNQNNHIMRGTAVYALLIKYN